MRSTSSSASCTRSRDEATRFGRGQRAIARLLLVTFLAISSLPTTNARAQEWEDANNTTFGDDVRLENSGDGLQTEFTIDSNQTTIGWQDLQQPEDNTLTFTFTNPTDQSTVLNYIGAQHPSQLNGRVECAGCTVAFSNPYGIYIGDQAVLDVGNLAMIAGEVDRIDFLSDGMLDADLEGIVTNDGRILAGGNVLLLGREVINNGTIQLDEGALLMLAGERVAGLDLDSLTNVLLGDGTDLVADLANGRVENNGIIAAPDAALVGSRVANHGEIEIADGTLLMVAADAIQFRRFDDPVSIHVPRIDTAAGSTDEDSAYAIENDGRIDAGLGHVRLSASDPLGFGIRQGTSGSIAAKRIEIEGGESGRVELAGTLDASDDSEQGRGGEIDVTGSIIVLADANIDASGTLGGGTIHVGGEQEGSGDLQRARAVIVDGESTIRADALDEGDGGRVIFFSEGLTSVDGEISATGGANGGDGGFVETSGLARFAVSKTPDVSAAKGKAGAWLIDPYDICISSDVMGCGATEPIPNSLDDAINALLDPDFDDSVFDGIIRTLGTSVVDPAVIAKALGVGTDVTLSTQAFEPGSVSSDKGDITIEETIEILNANTLPGTVATLTLLAAGNITLEAAANILSGTNLALSVSLQANDPGQNDLTQAFSGELLSGDVLINGNIETGGGDLTAQGIAIRQDAASEIRTLGGDVRFTSGTLDEDGNPTAIVSGGVPDPSDYSPVELTIEGMIDTSEAGDDGGDIALSASSANVIVDADYYVVTSELTIADTATLETGGGDLSLQGGEPKETIGVGFAANVQVDGALNTCVLATCSGDEIGGAITIDATHIDPTGGASANVTFVEPDSMNPRGEGGLITIDVGPNGIRTGGGALSIGSAPTRQISIDGELSTRGTSDLDEQGLISILALDELAADADPDAFGDAQVSIGTQGATLLSSAGITIQGRSITMSDAIAGNPVSFDVDESSSAELEGVTSGELRIVGNKNLDFGIDTSLKAESVVLAAATRPTELTDSERTAGEPAMSFRGGNGAGETGVQISATTVSITTGDGTTTTSNLFEDALVDESGNPTDFALSRGAYGIYDGLQLQSFDSATVRPDEIMISQDADFTISNAVAVGDGELNLVRAFDGATIGANGMRIEVESSDGVLTIEDATAFDNEGTTTPGSDAGKSWVTLLGGLLLPTAPDPVPSPESVPTPNSVVFGSDGGVTPLATPFDVEALVVSSPGDMSVDEQVALSVGTANELTFVAGRNTGVDDAAGRGTLTIGDDAASVVLQAGERLSILAGASGFGDLVFEATPTETISLRANEFLLRAGAGSSSLNSGGSDLSKILGLASSDIDLRDAAGNAFGSDASPEDVAFRYQQDAAIDTTTDLPSLAQFGLLPADGFRDARDVVYSVRSDAGAIDLDDEVVGTNEGDRFRDAALSLIGTEVGFAEALDVSDEFSFQGDSIEIGATGDFRYTVELANAFNRSNTNPNAEMTIRSGVGETGDLAFEANTEVVGARINLIAGDGIDGGSRSIVDARNASFDMSGANPDSKTFVYQQDDDDLATALLPTIDQFVGGIAGAPDILAIRSDSGTLDFTNFDATTVPVDTTGTISRLVLEADTIRFTQNDANNPNLDLESPNGLNLRLRANNLELNANDGESTELGGKVLLGSTAPANSTGNDAAFDNATLLIEAFDLESKSATVENLSSLSEIAPGVFDLAAGRGPTSIAINQNGSVAVDDLPDYRSVSGYFSRTLNDDEDGDPVATNYSIISSFGPVAVSPDKVENSDLVLIGDSGTTAMASDSAFAFEAGDYILSGLSASTEDSIEISENTTFTVENLLAMVAGLAANPETNLTDPLGSIRFERVGSTPTIDLTANQIRLIAGRESSITQPDGSDSDLDRDPVINALLPRIDYEGIRQIRRSGDAKDSSFRMVQNANLDLTTDLDMNGTPDLVEALAGGPQWDQVALGSVQAELGFSSVDNWVGITESLTLETGPDGSIVAEIDNQTSQFGAFSGDVVLASNDIKIKTEDAAIQLDLAAPNVEFRSTTTEADRRLPDDSERSKIRDDPDALERPIVRFQQVADFSDTASSLPALDQYTVVESDLNLDLSITTTIEPRENLNTLDIELEVTGAGETLTLDDAIRDSVFGSNLILKSAGDVAIDLSGAAPGYDEIEAAALSLSSLDIRTNFLRPGVGNVFFTIAGFPTAEQTDPMTGFVPPPAMIGTTGDQRFDGNLALQTSLTDRGRDITITGDVIAAPGAGLEIFTSGDVNFQGNIGNGGLLGFDSPLDHLKVLFEVPSTTTPKVEFGVREDLDGDGVDETPMDSNQTVRVENDVIFEAENATDETRGFRIIVPQFATIAKALGDLTFFLMGNGVLGDASEFIMGTGEKLSVGGTAQITAPGGNVRLGDVAAIDLIVTANEIALGRRATGTYFDSTGETQGDSGPTIAANTIRFEDGFGSELAPILVGSGKDTVFGVPNPFNRASYPSFLNQFSLFELRPGGTKFTPADFRFVSKGPELDAQVPALPPIGSSRSDLSRAFGPKRTPIPAREIPEPLEIVHPERLGELGVEPRIASSAVRVARLTGAAVIDDSELGREVDFVSVTQSRLDARDAEAAIVLYEELFGPDGDRAADVRSVLQVALDRYLEETRSRRVIGFELRRFVKNRPSTLIEAYDTLESLDELFRYHRRLGLSPGEYRKIQREWLREIQPDGITLDELSETIHPSRYVRGSDILDIFGQ